MARQQLQKPRIPEEYRWGGSVESVPQKCNCCDLNARKLIRRMNNKGWVFFCPATHWGFIQFFSTGIIIHGYFSGSPDGI